MLKRVAGKKLSRGGGARKALFRSLVRALVISGKITTTKAKAKAVVGQVDHVMTLLKKEDAGSRRRLLAILGNDQKTLQTLITRYLPVTKDRKSGFTRVVSLPSRRGDLAKMAVMEFVDKAVEIKSKPKEKKGVKNVKNVPAKRQRGETKARR